MSWFSRWKHQPLPQPRDLANLEGDALKDESTRTEIEKMRVEILDERSWRAKLLLSLILPVGGAIAFLNTWYNDHASERQHRSDQLYTDAAQQLSSTDASARLNAIQTLSKFITEDTESYWIMHPFRSGDECGRIDNMRSRQSIALIIGHLASEPDPSVLEAIAGVTVAHPCLTIEPLLSVDRSAAVDFSRAAGTFGGLFILRKKKAVAIPDTPEFIQLRNAAIENVNTITLRTGSPFEAKDMLNTSFVSRTFFGIHCPFLSLFEKQQRLTMSTGLSTPLLSAPPKIKDLQDALKDMEQHAATLEKVSYVLSALIKTGHGMDQLQVAGKPRNLYGVAIIVGEVSDDARKKVQTMGAYVQQYGVEGNCVLPPGPATGY